jgi:multiple sugar transport system substrate-binding protein
MKRVRIRAIAPVAAALCLAAAASACSSSNGSTSGDNAGGATTPAAADTAAADTPAATSSNSDDANPVTLTFWGTYGNGGNKAQTDVLSGTIIPAFEKAHPNITIKYVDIPYDSLLQKLETSAAGGELPDLIRSDITWVPKFAALGVFAQLDGKMTDFDKLSADTYPGSLATTKWQGHYYGLPLDPNTRVMISNAQALSSAGITAPPSTFDELKADGSALKAKKISVFADKGLQGWTLLPWIWSGGGDIANADLTKATGYLNSPQNVATLQMLVDMYKAGQIPNLLIGNKGATATQDGLPKGTYATILDGPWMHDIWAAQYPKFQPTYSPMPAGPGGSISVVGGEDIVMTTASKNPDAAEQFIAFTQTADYQIAMAKTGQMSVVKSLDDQEAAAVPYLAPYIKQLQTAKPRPAVPQEPQIDTALQNDLTPAFQGTTSVQAALDKAAKDIDPLLTATK